MTSRCVTSVFAFYCGLFTAGMRLIKLWGNLKIVEEKNHRHVVIYLFVVQHYM
jgi:hypothetical protein